MNGMREEDEGGREGGKERGGRGVFHGEKFPGFEKPGRSWWGLT
jgi:hypothetical protein